MIPLGAVKYTIYAALLVISIVMGLRFIVAHEMRREAWRSLVKRKIYISQKRFKVLTVILGWVLLVIGLSIAYFQIIGVLDAK